MAWPTGSVDTTNMDAGTDNVSLARAAIKDMADKVTALIAADPTGNITNVTTIANAANATANAANASISGADARYGSGFFNLTAVASAAGKLTLNVTGPFKADFRNANLTIGTPTVVSVTGNLSITSPKGATLGGLANQSLRLTPVLLYNGGNVTLGLANAGGMPLDEGVLYNTTVLNGTSNSSSALYSATAINQTAIRILGGIRGNQSALGNWSGANLTVQSTGGLAQITNAPLSNISAATRDQVLLVGETTYIDVSAQISVPLNIATGDNQLYELTLMMTGNGNTSGYPILSPNNTSYANFIYHTGIAESGGSAVNLGDYQSGFPLCRNGDIRQSRVTVSTKTTSKHATYLGMVYYTANSTYWASGLASWLSAASNSAATSDTTTLWTSLGTITFPVAATGRIIVRRLA